MLVMVLLYQAVSVFVPGRNCAYLVVPMRLGIAEIRTCRGSGNSFTVAVMNAFEQPRKPSNRVLAATRAGQIRRQRLAEARERETRIEQTVIDILAAKLVVSEAHHTIAAGVQQLKLLGETQDSIASLCELSIGEVRAATAFAREHTPTTESKAISAPARTLNDEEA
jgi:hypothetical protein